jgi:hypothetical protein
MEGFFFKISGVEACARGVETLLRSRLRGGPWMLCVRKKLQEQENAVYRDWPDLVRLFRKRSLLFGERLDTARRLQHLCDSSALTENGE